MGGGKDTVDDSDPRYDKIVSIVYSTAEELVDFLEKKFSKRTSGSIDIVLLYLHPR